MGREPLIKNELIRRIVDKPMPSEDMPHDEKSVSQTSREAPSHQISPAVSRRRRPLLKRYPWITVAVFLAIIIIGGAFAYAYSQKQSATTGDNFDPSSVLPPQAGDGDTSTVYTADTLKQFDGKSGNKCYVAVSGTVYEIKDSSYWRDGEHTPSGGRGVCGADMTQVITQSPHGTSILSRLTKVGSYQ